MAYRRSLVAASLLTLGIAMSTSAWSQAMQMRIDRLQSLPIIKDLEKMDRVREIWEPWFDTWKREPQRCELWPIGWMLMEYRVSLFAPNVPVKGSISEKKIRLAWEEIA